MTQRENMLRTINFEHPDYIPVNLVVNDSIYFRYDPDEIAELQESHPIIAGKHTIRHDLFERRRQIEERKREAAQRNETIPNNRFFDEFGVQWEKAIDASGAWCRTIFWRILQRSGTTGFPHGHLFLRLTDKCGYENVLLGMVDDDENLKLLIRRIEEHSLAYVEHWSKIGYDMIGFPGELGMQIGPMIFPTLFRVISSHPTNA